MKGQILIYIFLCILLSSNVYSQCESSTIDFTGMQGDANGATIGSVTFSFSGVDAGFRDGPGDITNVQAEGIESTDLTGVLRLDFVDCIDFLRFGFAFGADADQVNAIQATFFDINGSNILQVQGDAAVDGFNFVEGDLSGMPMMASYVEIEFLHNAAFAWIIDNVEFTCSTSCVADEVAAVPTLGQWGLIVLFLAFLSISLSAIKSRNNLNIKAA